MLQRAVFNGHLTDEEKGIWIRSIMRHLRNKAK